MKKIFFVFVLWGITVFSQNNNWQKINIPSGIFTTYFKIDNRDRCWLGASNGLYKSTDNFKSWSLVNNITSEVIEICPLPSGVLLVSTYDGLYISDSSGENFTNSNLKIRSINLVGNDIIAVQINEYNHKDICSSNDEGKSWTYRNIDPYSGDYYFLNLCAIDTTRLVANTDGRVLISNDGGYHWQEVLKYCCFNPSWYGIDSKNNIYLARIGELLVSQDYGSMWNKISSESILSLYSNRTNLVLISTSNGVKISYDYTSTWQNLGFTNSSNCNFELTNKGYLYFRTMEKGLYKYNQLITSVKRDSIFNKDNRVLSNFPNPFNNSTKIKYQINSNTDVILSIYDAIGKLIERNIFYNENAGEYYYDFNSKYLSTGIYVVRMQTYSSTSFIKILLMK